MSIDEAAARIAGFRNPQELLEAPGHSPGHWFHSMVFADGTKVDAPVKSLDTLRVECDGCFGPVDFRGKSVLDIGAWDGAFSAEAKRRGAARVRGVDHWAWTVTEGRALERYLYVSKDGGFDFEAQIIDVPDLSVETVGQWDIVLFLGVLYHLREPISIIGRLADIAKECLVLETHLDCQDLIYPAMRHYPGAELGGDVTNWWGPNVPCVEAFLKHAGFREINYRQHPFASNRGIFHAWR